MPFNRTAAMRAVHALGKKHGYSHDDLRDLAASQFSISRDKVSLGKLTDSQLGAFCAALKGDKQSGPVRVVNKATSRQLWKINQLATLIGMQSNPARLEGFLQRQAKKSRLEDLTKFDAIKVIDGLKNLAERCNTEGNDHGHQRSDTSSFPELPGQSLLPDPRDRALYRLFPLVHSASH